MRGRRRQRAEQEVARNVQGTIKPVVTNTPRRPPPREPRSTLATVPMEEKRAGNSRYIHNTIYVSVGFVTFDDELY